MAQSTSRVLICPKPHFNDSFPQRLKKDLKKKKKKECKGSAVVGMRL